MTPRPFRLPHDARLVRFPASDGTELEGRLTVAGADRGPHGGVVLTLGAACREAIAWAAAGRS